MNRKQRHKLAMATSAGMEPEIQRWWRRNLRQTEGRRRRQQWMEWLDFLASKVTAPFNPQARGTWANYGEEYRRISMEEMIAKMRNSMSRLVLTPPQLADLVSATILS